MYLIYKHKQPTLSENKVNFINERKRIQQKQNHETKMNEHKVTTQSIMKHFWSNKKNLCFIHNKSPLQMRPTQVR